MSTTPTTAAVERGAEALAAELGETPDLEHAAISHAVLSAGVNAFQVSTVLEQHQRVVGPHGLTRCCTCSTDLGPIGELVHHQAEAIRASIVGEA